MKTVFVLTEIAIGGAERVVLDLCCELKKRSHEAAVVSLKNLCPDDLMVQAFQKENIDIFSLGLDKKHPFRVFKLKKLIESLNPDCVSAHLFHPNILTRIFLRKRNFKLVNTIHIMEIRESEKWRFIVDRLTFKMADIHTAVSQAAADFQAGKLQVPAEEFTVIRNGIKIPRKLTDTEKNALHEKWGVKECDIILGCVGRLNHQKGFDILLGMQSEISRVFANKKIGLVFIGDGPERENLQKLAANPPENMKITFAGYSAEAALECGAFDLFLMPSRFEGFGLTLAEASAHEIPAVIQNIAPLAEVASTIPNAVLTDFANDPAGTAELMKKMLESETKSSPQITDISSMTDRYLEVFRTND